jgi:putative transposase
MRKRRYTEEQIIKVLREQESGSKVPELCRKYGISEQTFYRWRSKYGGMSVSEARRLKVLEEENHRLKQIVGWQVTDLIQIVIVTYLSKYEWRGTDIQRHIDQIVRRVTVGNNYFYQSITLHGNLLKNYEQAP